MVHFDIALACALDPAGVSVPEPHETPDADEPDDPLALDEVDELALLLSFPHAESVAVASRPTPATSANRWSFAATVLSWANRFPWGSGPAAGFVSLSSSGTGEARSGR
ncbi:hypothetical protein OG568_08500 [Streptomyces sp. NBC_01450]|uniref:hypothetical protein n=1 Tax=Streptomyces sp. NBC_01450 TaxID=2903871 RepID=UPI002E35161D|nr:hypothetical protein [Streptomyces sp. NBC_01450]